ncbi:MAG: hypothetical protein ACLFUF_03715 [Opitutales bacterium]
MARLTETDREHFRKLKKTGWRQSDSEQSPARVAPTMEARNRYCRWAAEAAKFYKGAKPVRFGGGHWKL